MLFLAGENPFQAREYPWTMDFLHRKKKHNIQIPDGYAIESSTPAVITMQDLGSFTFITNVLGSQIQISIITSINKVITRIIFDR
jgi:hypothetical protein